MRITREKYPRGDFDPERKMDRVQFERKKARFIVMRDDYAWLDDVKLERCDGRIGRGVDHPLPVQRNY